MSAFLGHIHFWLYKKIRLVIAREGLVLEKGRETLGDLADELHESALALYGDPLSEAEPLEAIIDHGNIHGWLHNQIMTASVREASFIKDLVDCGAEEGEIAVFSAFAEQGQACGTVARDELAETTPNMIYTVMQNYYLNGMPCDGGDVVLSDTPESYEWEGTHRNQMENWQKAGVDVQFMAKAYQSWFKGFVEAVAPGYTFTVTAGAVPVYAIRKA